MGGESKGRLVLEPGQETLGTGPRPGTGASRGLVNVSDGFKTVFWVLSESAARRAERLPSPKRPSDDDLCASSTMKPGSESQAEGQGMERELMNVSSDLRPVPWGLASDPG